MQVSRIEIDKERVRGVSEIIKKLPDRDQGLNFYSFKKGDTEVVASDMYPSKGHPKTIDFFSFACLHQFGFWLSNSNGYQKPLVGLISGKEAKGSDLLWKALKQALDKNQEVFDPQHLSNMKEEELRREIFVDDNGPIPFEDIEKRHEITKDYGKWFIENNTTPKEIVDLANATSTPLRSFLDKIQQVPSFSQDPLEKKALLLAMALSNRPEGFLKVTDTENWRPIVDYHLMRVALRLGLVEINDAERKVNKERQWATRDSEELIREAVYEVMQDIIRESGRPMSLLDHTMWLARRYCPEMTEPDCPKCIFTNVCKKDIELFQPVLRTINY